MNKFTQIIVALVFLALLVPAAHGETQRGRKARAKTRHSQPVAVKKLPAAHQRILVRGATFFFHSGIFYTKGPLGFQVVAAPIGARVRVLPPGHTMLRIGGLDYFYYYGTYYQKLPGEEVYSVVEAPSPAPSSDVVHLVNGDVLHGRFIGGDANSIQFAVGEQIHHLPLTEVVSLELEPPAP